MCKKLQVEYIHSPICISMGCGCSIKLNTFQQMMIQALHKWQNTKWENLTHCKVN